MPLPRSLSAVAAGAASTLLIATAALPAQAASTRVPSGRALSLHRTVGAPGSYDLVLTARAAGRGARTRTLVVDAGGRHWTVRVSGAHRTVRRHRTVTIHSKKLHVRLRARGGPVSVMGFAAKRRKTSPPPVPIAPAPTDPAPAPTPDPAPTPGPIVTPSYTHLVWSDEFDGTRGSAPDPARWSHDLGGHGWGNQELQSYTASTANAALDGAGDLTITARRQQVTGPDGITRDWSSARLTTKGHATFSQGRLEIRARVPAGQGLVSQMWMMGDDVWDVGWPLCGEVDLSEILGSQTGTTYGTVHGPLADGSTPYAIGRQTALATPADGAFHVYSVTWNADSVTWAVDGTPYAQITPADMPAGGQWRYARPLYLLLDLAVGGTFAGSPTQSTPSAANLTIDWVRVFG